MWRKPAGPSMLLAESLVCTVSTAGYSLNTVDYTDSPKEDQDQLYDYIEYPFEVILNSNEEPVVGKRFDSFFNQRARER